MQKGSTILIATVGAADLLEKMPFWAKQFSIPTFKMYEDLEALYSKYNSATFRGTSNKADNPSDVLGYLSEPIKFFHQIFGEDVYARTLAQEIYRQRPQVGIVQNISTMDDVIALQEVCSERGWGFAVWLFITPGVDSKPDIGIADDRFFKKSTRGRKTEWVPTIKNARVFSESLETLWSAVCEALQGINDSIAPPDTGTSSGSAYGADSPTQVRRYNPVRNY